MRNRHSRTHPSSFPHLPRRSFPHPPTVIPAKAGIQGGAPGWRGLLHPPNLALHGELRKGLRKRESRGVRIQGRRYFQTPSWRASGPVHSRRAATRPPMPSRDHCFHSTPMLDRDPHKAVAQRPAPPCHPTTTASTAHPCWTATPTKPSRSDPSRRRPQAGTQLSPRRRYGNDWTDGAGHPVRRVLVHPVPVYPGHRQGVVRSDAHQGDRGHRPIWRRPVGEPGA